MEQIWNIFEPKSIYFSHLLLVMAAFVAILVLRGFKGYLLHQSKQHLIGASLYASYRPAMMFLSLLVFWYTLSLINAYWQLALDLHRYPMVQLLTALALSWYGYRVVNTVEGASLENTDTGKLDQTAIIGIAKICRLLLTAILTIVGFDLLGLDASGLIALGSVSGAALAFASKDLVSNWFGGIMLYLDKPFKVGDWIRSPDREIEGTVEYIGWRITKIRSFDKRPLYVPNALFNNITVQNPSRMTHRRIKESIGVRYDDMAQVEAIVADIEAYLKGSDLVAQDQIQIVNFNGFGASSLDILIYCMTVTTDWQTYHHHKQAVLLHVAKLVEQRGAEFAFPTQTLHLQKEPNDVEA
mgnify:CR=1 FL=1